MWVLDKEWQLALSEHNQLWVGPHITEQDFFEVQSLIGRAPLGLHRILKRDPVNNEIALVEVYPIFKGTPFPTLYWLTGRRLHKKISQLEASGMVGEFEKRLSSNGPFKATLKQQTQQYQQSRDELYQAYPDFHHSLYEKIKMTGIGGMEKEGHVKCLHLHVAHHLAQENIIGQLTLEKLETL